MRALALTICAALAASGAMAQERPDFYALSEVFSSITVLRCEADEGVRYFVYQEADGDIVPYGVQNGIGERIVPMTVERLGKWISFSDGQRLDVISTKSLTPELAEMTGDAVVGVKCARLSSELFYLFSQLADSSD